MTPNVVAEVRRLMLTGLTPERAVLTVDNNYSRWVMVLDVDKLTELLTSEV